ncbi:MAG: NUDIX hydrolase [Bacteroidales bacterium]|nr:NUDIX hydrolase [Bacteroidales bacterium]
MPYCYTYPRPAFTVDIIVLSKEEKILLIQRKKPPFKGQWALPGGFVDLDETLEQAALRELKEETGISFDTLTAFKIYDAIDRDPRHRTISMVFFKTELAMHNLSVIAGDDAASAQWFSIYDLPELAFDHKKIIRDFMSFLSYNF